MTGSSKGIRQLSSRAASPMTSILVYLATIGVAQAQDLCTNIDYLIDQSRSQFVAIVDKPSGDRGDHAATLTLADASYCFVTKQPKRNLYHCGWEFPYREKHAYDTFDEFVREMTECIGHHATLHTDQNVNHPDYYALRRYEMEQAEVSVSVKDKAALGSTFVFIRVQGGTND